jgi:hypothetical protein
MSGARDTGAFPLDLAAMRARRARFDDATAAFWDHQRRLAGVTDAAVGRLALTAGLPPGAPALNGHRPPGGAPAG